MTEGSLVSAAVYGATLEEASSNRLREAIARLDEEGKGRNATAAVAMLVHACRMGLHRHAPELVGLIAARIGEEPAFVGAIQAANQLLMLWQSRRAPGGPLAHQKRCRSCSRRPTCARAIWRRAWRRVLKKRSARRSTALLGARAAGGCRRLIAGSRTLLGCGEPRASRYQVKRTLPTVRSPARWPASCSAPEG